MTLTPEPDPVSQDIDAPPADPQVDLTPAAPPADPQESRHIYGDTVGSASIDLWHKPGEVHLALDRPGLAGIRVVLSDAQWDAITAAVNNAREFG